MNKLERIIQEYDGEELLIADGFNDAVIGIDYSSKRLIYSIKACVEILCRDMSEEDAVEYFFFNVAGAYVGERTPIWCEDFAE